jgi:hypothetical protein
VTRTAFILVMLLAGICLLPAQISNYYVFSSTTETYAPITGTSIPTAVGDNVMSNPVDIGFPFLYGTNTYSQIKVSSNGYVTLGTAPGSSANNALISTICPVLAPLWDNLYLQGSAQYLLSGTAPNRVFTLQFTGVKWPANSATIFNFQVRLYENRTVEFIYGPSVGIPTNASASIGINMLPGGFENFYSITPGNPPTYSTSYENTTVNTWPGTNTKYVFSTPIQYANDLAALSISGNQTPTAGMSYNYAISIRNNGSSAQTDYNVKIMSGTTQLASVAGPTIASQSTLNITVPWTPDTPGVTAITGKVDLAGDENTTNDSTPPLSLTVQAPGTTALTIGDGSETARKPIDLAYLNSIFQTIFPANEVTVNGTITGVSFYNNFVEHRPNIHTKIWLGTTTQTNLSAGWIPAYQMTLVFDGNVSYPNGQNVIHITFDADNPFTYSGGNLVMMVNRPMDTNYYSSGNVFLCQTAGTNRSRNAYSDATAFDPNNMGTVGTVSGQFPKTTFYLVPAAVDPAFSVSPESHDFGQVIINQAQSQVFHVFNSGGGILNISGINISGSPYFTLQSLPDLPVALNSGQFTTFMVQYQPTASGDHNGTVSITDDLARLTHPVSLSGSCVDPTVNVVPYNQNFDTVVAPGLPLGWQKLTWGSATVTTVTNSPFSAPNCVLMNNTNSSMGPFLIAPPIVSSIPVNTLKVRFKAKAASGFSLNVGVMTNPQDVATYVDIQNVMLSNEWTEYAVDLRNYPGPGSYIAFKHNQGGNNRSIYVDNVSIEPLLTNDLAALQISGETAPNAGTAYNYSITIFNGGMNAQDDYQVKLYKTGNIELASAQGPAIAGNSQVIVTIPWTPETVGQTHIYGKVILADDQNSNNDQTPELPITVQESQTTLVVVGSGNQLGHEAPVDMNALSSLYENIYRQDELTQAGLISIVNFYNFFTSNIPPKHTKIWLGMTEQTDLSNGWIPASQLTLVFDGEVSYPAGVNTISIVLQQPFTLVQGYNLVMLVQRTLDTETYSIWDNFACQTDVSNRTRRVSSSVDLDPDNPPTGTFTGQFPKTGFYITPGGSGNLTGIVYGANNQPLVNSTVSLSNGPQTTTDTTGQYYFQNIFSRDYAVTASAHGYDDLTQYVTVLDDSTFILDFTLTPTPTVTVTGTLVGSDNPTLGLAGAQITLSGYDDYQASTDNSGNFSLTGVYAGHTYAYQASAPGYDPSMGSITLGSTDYDLGTIVLNEIAYPPSGVLASVTTDHTSAEIIWLSPNQENRSRELVGYKVWRLLQGQEQSEAAWVLLTPVTITLQRYTDTDWDTLPQGFYKWAVKSVYSNDIVSNPALSNALETTGILTGVVRNSQMNPIMGATVTAGSFSATSAADGSYTLYLPGGTYNVSCTLNGYYVNTQYNVEVVVGQTTQLDFTIIFVDNDDAIQIVETKLNGNFPNPFNPETTISFDIKEPSNVRLDIFNLKGQLIRSLVREEKAPGRYNVLWDGKDEHGDDVGSGIYQYLLKAGKYRKSNRMTLNK